jgi:hypothetical protein
VVTCNQTEDRAANVKTECVAGAVALAFMNVTPALAAARQIEDFCLEQLYQATIPWRRAAGEAFMANCIANFTPSTTEKRTYRKYRKH